LGRSILEAALVTGDRVVAGARRLEELGILVEQYGDRIRPVKIPSFNRMNHTSKRLRQSCGGTK